MMSHAILTPRFNESFETLRLKEKILVTSFISSSPNVFYPVKDKKLEEHSFCPLQMLSIWLTLSQTKDFRHLKLE